MTIILLCAGSRKRCLYVIHIPQIFRILYLGKLKFGGEGLGNGLSQNSVVQRRFYNDLSYIYIHRAPP